MGRGLNASLLFDCYPLTSAVSTIHYGMNKLHTHHAVRYGWEIEARIVFAVFLCIHGIEKFPMNIRKSYE